MPHFLDFVAQLDAAGVVIVGRDELIATVESTPDWPEVVAELASKRRKSGIAFRRAAADSPSDSHLDQLLESYPFSYAQRNLVVRNVLVRP